MDIEYYGRIGDVLAIPCFAALAYYLYKKEKRTRLESFLLLFAIIGLAVDTFLTAARYTL